MMIVEAIGQWWHADKVLLWTDALLFVMVSAVIVAARSAVKDLPLRAAWRRVFRNPLAGAAAVVMTAYLAIALVDSVHYYPVRGNDGPETGPTAMVSLLDDMLLPLREQVEESYSRPLAIHALNTKATTLPDGTQGRAVPRLRFGGAHLASPEAHGRDIATRFLSSCAWGGLAWTILIGFVILLVARRCRTTFARARHLLLVDPSAVAERSVLVGLLFVTLGAGVVATLGPYYHLLGTDKVGNDVLYLCLKSIRTGLVIGALTTLVSLPIAMILGVAAGYWRGRVDDAVQYLYTTLDSIPFVLLVAAMVLVMQAYMSTHEQLFGSVEQRSDVRLLLLCLVLGLTRWTDLCRLMRGETLKLRELDYVQAARGLGVTWPRLLRRTIIPNVMHLVLITVVMQFSGLVLAEAVLSYIGIGVDPGMNSWGNMINAARLELAREPVIWWSLSAALVFMFVLVLAVNLFSDAVRDAFDPRLNALRS